MNTIYAALGRGLAVLCLLLAGPAHASAYFSISTADEWRQNLGDGHIQVADAWNEGFEALYPGQSPYFATPALSVLDELDGKPALAMDFGVGSAPAIGAWYYLYAEEPALLDAKIELSIKKRGAKDKPGDFSIKLKDKAGKWMSWAWDIPAQNDAEPWHEHSMKVNGGQQGAKTYKVDGGFDGNKVVAIYFDYRGIETTTPEKRTAYFDHVKVSPVPEPESVALLGLGLAGVLLHRRGWRRSQYP